MDNPHAEWRIKFARHLVQRLDGLPGLSAAVAAGSTARGWADEYSDLEIALFWEELPSDRFRLALAAQLGGEFLYRFDLGSREDQLLVSGLQVDLWHIPLGHQEETIQAVLSGRRSDLSSLNALDTVRSCIPLLGEEIVHGWKRQAEEYPDILAERIIQELLPCFSIGELFLHAQRGSPSAYFGQLVQLQQTVFLVLLALNRRYFPTFKWMDRTLAELDLKPPELKIRFQTAYHSPPHQAVAETQSLLEETLTLVKECFPAIDTRQAETKTSYKRSPIQRGGPTPAIWKGTEEE